MAIQRVFDTITVVASQDLSANQFKCVSLGGLVAATSALAVGIQQTKALNADHMTVGYRGHMKAFAGAAINSNAPIAPTTSGFMGAYTPAGSGGLGAVGRCLTGAASGDLFDFIGDFSQSPA